MINYCKGHGNKFGSNLIDYGNVDMDLLECYLNMSMPAMSTVHFKDMMSHSTLSKTVTIGEEAFAILVFENNFNRWLYQAEEQRAGMEDTTCDVPDVLYQQKVKKRKDNRDTAGRWTDEGMERLNYFIKAIKEYRSGGKGGGLTRDVVEEELKRRYEMELNGQSELMRRRKRRMDRSRDDDEVVTKKVVVENMLNLTEL